MILCNYLCMLTTRTLILSLYFKNNQTLLPRPREGTAISVGGREEPLPINFSSSVTAYFVIMGDGM